ncbi:MAG: anti-sigma regulatory factor [Ignavibacteriae bacterium]|nr:anti-sigma regulatory factor [Ignavibacteriota bacterium]
MDGGSTIAITSDSDIIVARELGRRVGKELDFSLTDLTIIATVISELARNIIIFAKHGDMIIETIRHGKKVGIVITAVDKGPGIPDIFLAMQDGYSTGKGLGLGLPGVRRLMDEFEIFSETGKGTRVSVKKWLM